MKTSVTLSISWHFLAQRTLRALLWGPAASLYVPLSLSQDSWSVPPVRLPGHWVELGGSVLPNIPMPLLSSGRIQHATMNAPTAKNPTNNYLSLLCRSELELCNQIQVLPCDLSAAAGGKDVAITGGVPIKSVDQGLATGRKQRSSPIPLGDSASLLGYLGCPCSLGTPKAGGSIHHACWMRHRSLLFPRVSCQLLAWQLLPAQKGVIKNQVSGITWPDALLHLKAWLRARLALKFSLSGPYSVNGSPRSTALPRNKTETAGKRVPPDSCQEACWLLFPILFGSCIAWWPPDPSRSSGYHGASCCHWCMD